MKHEGQVVMLPTENTTSIVLHSTGLDNILHTKESAENAVLNIGGQCQYLYITVSQDVEPVKEGDWQTLIVNRPNGNLETVVCQHTLEGIGGGRKIIATNDPKLTHPSKVQYGNMTMIDHNKDGSWYHAINVEVEFSLSREELVQRGVIIPQIQQSFLKEFVINPNGEFVVEYEYGYSLKMRRGNTNHMYKLKLNQDNTVNITSVEEKMYSREQMIYAYEDGVDDGIDHSTSYTDRSKLKKDWIKENLK